jgi:hypothetical protein
MSSSMYLFYFISFPAVIEVPSLTDWCCSTIRIHVFGSRCAHASSLPHFSLQTCYLSNVEGGIDDDDGFDFVSRRDIWRGVILSPNTYT